MAKRRPPIIPDDTAPESMKAVCRNVVVAGRRTSIRMEPLQWDSLAEICSRENRTTNEVVNLIDRRRGDSALTAALRIFILSYFRIASTPQHPVAGMAEEQAAFRHERAYSPVFEQALEIFNEGKTPD